MLSCFSIGILGLSGVLVSAINKTRKGRKVFGIGMSFTTIIFLAILILGGFVAIDDVNQTRITEGILSSLKKESKNTVTENETQKMQNQNSNMQASSQEIKDSTTDNKSSSGENARNSNLKNDTKQLSMKGNIETNENDPLQIESCIPTQISTGQLVAKYKVKNNSKKTIDAYITTTLMFDGFDEPVLYYNTQSNHINHEHQDYTLAPGIKDEILGSEVMDKTKKVKGIIMKVHFTDGTTWENPRWDKFIKDQGKKY